MNFAQLSKLNEDQAREYLESVRWPNGAVCAHCDSQNVIKLPPTIPVVKPGQKKRVPRYGLYKCRDCRKQFSVTVGTVMERSHVKIREWVMAFHLISASKKGISSLQLKRMLGVQYKTAWHITHRIRHSMQEEPLKTVLSVTVKIDECYIGGKPRPGMPKFKPNGKRYTGRGTRKTPVVVLVERDGNARTHVVERVTAPILRKAITESTKQGSRFMTDEFAVYRKAGLGHSRGHQLVNHSAGEYARGDVHINTAESFFALLKRGVHGTFHHVSKHHLHRYCSEFAFRWNARKVNDGDRTKLIIRATEGKRLMYKQPKSTK